MVVSPPDLVRGASGGDIPLLVDPPARRPRWWIEALVIVWLCWAYDLIANLAPLRQGAAIHHGRAILDLEAFLHLDPELTLDRWLAPHHTVALWVSTYYDNAHFVVTLAVVAWLWWRHPRQYRPLRTTLVLVNVIGFVVFVADPTAPPRLLPGHRIADVVASTEAFGSWHSGSLAHHANELAAMPSLHIAWAAWSALAVWTVLRSRRGAGLVWLYPLVTALAVLATGNHYLADVVAGAATLVIAAWLAPPWCRLASPLLLRLRVLWRSWPAAIDVDGASPTAGSGPPRRRR